MRKGGGQSTPQERTMILATAPLKAPSAAELHACHEEQDRITDARDAPADAP